MSDPQVKIDADDLTRELMKLVEQSKDGDVLVSSAVAAAFAQAMCEAILQLLHHKGIVSDAEIQKALADAYHARAYRLKNSGAMIAPPPMLRPNGSF